MFYDCKFKLPNNTYHEFKKISSTELRKKLEELLKTNYFWVRKITNCAFYNLYSRLTDENSTRKCHPILLNVIQLERV